MARTGDAVNSPSRSRLRTRQRESTTSMPCTEDEKPALEYNQKIEGYLTILIASLVNFASISDISVATLSRISLKDEKVVAIFGAVSFGVCFFIIAFDRIRALHQMFDFKEAWDGKVEGYTLFFLVLWWIVGVAIITKADGIAYRALNTYFSSWYALFMSAHTFNRWTSAKDILSIQELTRLSDTLPYWYALFLCSLIVMGSAADVFVHLRRDDLELISTGKSPYAIFVGAVSAPIALCAILAHYKLLCCGCGKVRPHGGVTELSVALLLFLWWILAVSLLTADNAVASTIQGGQPIPILDDERTRRILLEYSGDGDGGLNANNNDTIFCECMNHTLTNTTLSDDDTVPSNRNPIPISIPPGSINPVFPGNNLYLWLWLGLYSSAQICFKWKTARAMVQMSDAMRHDAETSDDHIAGIEAPASAKSANRGRHDGSDDDVD